MLRYVREADELQGRIVLESLAGAFALGSLLTFGYGLLQIAGAPAVSWLFVRPVYAACWLVTGAPGRYDPSLPLAFRIAAVFELRIEDIFSPSAVEIGR